MGIVGGIGVDADFEATIFVSPSHQAAKVATEVGGNHLDFAFIDETSGTVDGEDVAFVVDFIANFEGLFLFVDNDFGRTSDAAFTHGTGNDRSVGGHTATSGEDGFGIDHTDDVFRRSFSTDKDDFLSSVVPGFAFFSGEDDRTSASARGSGEAFDDGVMSLEIFFVEGRVEQVIELLRLDAADRGLFVDESFVDEVASDLQRGVGRALAITGLQEEELAVFDGVFHVLHIVEIGFHALDGFHELFVDFRHALFEFVDVKRSADTSDDVFALGVRKELGVDFLFTGGRVTGERDTSAAIFAHVAEDHRLDVDGGAPFIGDAVHLTIDVGTGVVPAAENGGNRFFELDIRILREIFPKGLLVVGFVFANEGLKLIRSDFGVELITVFFLDLVEHRVHFGARMSFGDVGIHQKETTIGVPSKTFVAGSLREFFNGGIVGSEVEDRVHHTRHGLTSTRTNRDEKRHALSAAEFLSVDFFHFVNMFHDVLPDEIGDLLTRIVVEGASFGGDVDPSGSHLGKTKALSTKDLFADFSGVSFFEGIYVLFLCHFFLLMTISGALAPTGSILP